jgi:hypothetical protein
MPTKTPELAQCPRCGQFALLADRAVITVGVDVAPLTPQGYADAVVRGWGLWWVTVGQNGAAEALGPAGAAPRPSWGENGAQTGAQRLHAEHSCGVAHRDLKPVGLGRPEPAGPRRASATSGSSRAGSRPLAALAGAPTGSSPAAPAIPRRSETPRPVRCHDCRKLIDQTKPFFGIHHDNWIWAVHDECP